MDTVLIVGYGNQLRSDDGLGFRTAEILCRSAPSPGVEILACHQLTPELAERMSHADAVLFIDAARSGPSGEILSKQIEPSPDQLFAHQLTPETLLALCCELFGACPQAFVISLRGECFELADKLSPEVTVLLPRLVEFVANFEKRLRESDPNQATCRAS
ncbi:MAG: hydrogenase maturation protease [Candidatus Sulfotelmatobacter sp.]